MARLDPKRIVQKSTELIREAEALRDTAARLQKEAESKRAESVERQAAARQRRRKG